MRILLIEDYHDLAEAIIAGLTQKQFMVDWLKEGKTADYFIHQTNIDIIILDLGLPKIPGIDVLKSIRKAKITTPIIVLTAQDSIEDCVQALNLGADDYMSKPFDLNELIARIRALTRRSLGRAQVNIHYKNITLDPISHTVTINEEIKYLPRREFTLLQKFLEHQGKVLSREQLMNSIYSWDEEVDSNTLEVHIHNLRKKFESLNLRTIRGIGYILEKVQDHELDS
jgi:two-component system response regulator QseB